MANLNRLLLVARALRESESPQAFIMSRIHTCGTPNCAFGNYVARRDLQQIFQFPLWDCAERIYEETHGNTNNMILQGVWGATRPVFIWRHAIMDHFELTPEQVEQLFGPHGCNDAETAAVAADYIERFVRTQKQLEEGYKP